MSFNFFTNKRKVVQSKITFTTPNKTTLSQEELSNISTDDSQVIKKLKTATNDKNRKTEHITNTTCSSTTNVTMDSEPTSSNSNPTEASDEAMNLDTEKNDEN